MGLFKVSGVILIKMTLSGHEFVLESIQRGCKSSLSLCLTAPLLF